MTQRAKQYKHTEIKGLEVEFQEYSQAYKYKNGHALIPKEIVETGKDWELIEEEPQFYKIVRDIPDLKAMWYAIFSNFRLEDNDLEVIENFLNNKVEPKETPEEKLDREWPPYPYNEKEELTKERLLNDFGCWMLVNSRNPRHSNHVAQSVIDYLKVNNLNLKEEESK